MNYEKQTPKIPGLADVYRHAFSNPTEEQNISDRVEMARSVGGYEAVFDPDKAVMDLGNRAAEEAEDVLNPQHQPKYETSEGGRFDFLDKALVADPNHTIQDGHKARQLAEASITSHPDGTHTLSWEMQPEVTTNNSGQVVRHHTKPN